MKNSVLIFALVVLGINSVVAADWVYPRKDAELPPFDMPIKGYGDFKFGMTLEDAKRINPRIEIVPITLGLTEEEKANLSDEERHACGGPDRACGIFSGVISFKKVEVELSASDGKHINRISVQFQHRDTSEERWCKSTGKEVMERMMDKYGLPTKYILAKGNGFYWESTSGGTVQFNAVCFTDDRGWLSVAYTESLGL